jgi:hypothetical protein
VGQVYNQPLVKRQVGKPVFRSEMDLPVRPWKLRLLMWAVDAALSARERILVAVRRGLL